MLAIGGAEYWGKPAAVVITWRDGSQTEQFFENRAQAETFLALIPIMAHDDDDMAEVASAHVRPINISLN